jgi:hypothetical protein
MAPEGRKQHDVPIEYWAVHRQDDNGNRFVVERYLTREAADRLVEELTARGHKQFYWAEPESGG